MRAGSSRALCTSSSYHACHLPSSRTVRNNTFMLLMAFTMFRNDFLTPNLNPISYPSSTESTMSRQPRLPFELLSKVIQEYIANEINAMISDPPNSKKPSYRTAASDLALVNLDFAREVHFISGRYLNNVKDAVWVELGRTMVLCETLIWASGQEV